MAREKKGIQEIYRAAKIFIKESNGDFFQASKLLKIGIKVCQMIIQVKIMNIIAGSMQMESTLLQIFLVVGVEGLNGL